MRIWRALKAAGAGLLRDGAYLLPSGERSREVLEEQGADIKAAGGLVIAQDEATCVIFGMPAEAIKIGAVNQTLGIDDIYPAIEKRVISICRPVPAGER